MKDILERLVSGELDVDEAENFSRPITYWSLTI